MSIDMAEKTKQNEVDSVPQTSSAVMSFPQPPLKKASDYLAAYAGYVYTATSSIAQDVASIELELFRVKYPQGKPETEQIYVHEVLSILDGANPMMGRYDLLEATQVYLELVGEAFWVVLREPNGRPVEIWPIRPDWVRVVPDKENIIGEYIYSPGGTMQEKISIPKENVIHFKYMNPLNPYRGKGSVQAAAMSIDVHEFAQEWNRNFFFNSATPGLVFTTDNNKMNDKTIKRFMESWKQNYQGRSKSHKVAFLSGGFKMEKASLNAKELDFVDQKKVFRDDILAVFKVPKTVIGMVEDVNRSNAEATTSTYMQRVITPRMKKLVSTLQEFFIPMFNPTENLFLDFIDPAPEDVEKKLKYYENGRKYNWLTPNEIRLRENLEPIEGGDDLFELQEPVDESLMDKFMKRNNEHPNRKLLSKPKRKHMMPIPQQTVQQIDKKKLQASLTKDLYHLIGQLMKTSKKETGQEEFKQISGYTKAQKDEIWNKVVKRATKKEMEMRDIIIPLFEEQGKQVIDKLDQIKYLPKAERKDQVDDVLFNEEEWEQRWMTNVKPFVKEYVILSGTQTLATLGVNAPFDTDSEATLRFLQVKLGNMITNINETTRQDIEKALREGVANEESIDKLRDRVKGVIDYATDERAKTIARTEVFRAFNFSNVEAYRQSGVVQLREWLSARDSRVRHTHSLADGQRVKLNEKFDVGGAALDYPGDPDGPAEETINCRCVEVPITLLDQQTEAELQIDYAKRKAQGIIDKATKEAHELVEQARESIDVAEETKGKGKEQLQKAEKEANKLVREARKQADEIVKQAEDKAKEEKDTVIVSAKNKASEVINQAKEQAETERATILGEIKKLRDKAREVLGGGESK